MEREKPTSERIDGLRDAIEYVKFHLNEDGSNKEYLMAYLKENSTLDPEKIRTLVDSIATRKAKGRLDDFIIERIAAGDSDTEIVRELRDKRGASIEDVKKRIDKIRKGRHKELELLK